MAPGHPLRPGYAVGYAHRKWQKLFTLKVHFASQVAEPSQSCAPGGSSVRSPRETALQGGTQAAPAEPGSGRAVVAAWRGTEGQLVRAWSVHSHGSPKGPANWPPSQFPKVTSRVLHPACTHPPLQDRQEVEEMEEGLQGGSWQIPERRGGTAGRVSTGQNSGTLAIWGTLTSWFGKKAGSPARLAGALMLP